MFLFVTIIYYIVENTALKNIYLINWFFDKKRELTWYLLLLTLIFSKTVKGCWQLKLSGRSDVLNQYLTAPNLLSNEDGAFFSGSLTLKGKVIIPSSTMPWEISVKSKLFIDKIIV